MSKAKTTLLDKLKSKPAKRFWWMALSAEQIEELKAIRRAYQNREINHPVASIYKMLIDEGWPIQCNVNGFWRYFQLKD